MRRKETRADKLIVGELKVTPEDVLMIVGTNDQRLKVVAEEFASPLGVRIIHLLSLEPLTVMQISKTLGESIQTVSHHIKRMMEAEIIKVDGYEASQRGKTVKKYALNKLAFLLVVDYSDEERKELLKVLKRIAVKRLHRRILYTLSTFISFWLLSFMAFYLVTSPIIGGQYFYVSIPGLEPGAFVWAEPFVIFPLVLGAFAGVITWFILSRKIVRLQKTFL